MLSYGFSNCCIVLWRNRRLSPYKYSSTTTCTLLLLDYIIQLNCVPSYYTLIQKSSMEKNESPNGQRPLTCILSCILWKRLILNIKISYLPKIFYLFWLAANFLKVHLTKALPEAHKWPFEHHGQLDPIAL